MSSDSTNPYESPPQEPALEPPERDSNATSQRRTLTVIYLLYAAWGVVQVISFDNATLHIAFALLIAFAITNWAVVDNRRRQGRFRGLLVVLFFFLWPIASLIYLIATRRLKGLGWWIVNAIGFYGTIVIAMLMALLFLFLIGKQELIQTEIAL